MRRLWHKRIDLAETETAKNRYITFNLRWDPQEVWIGVRIKHGKSHDFEHLRQREVVIAFLPCILLRIYASWWSVADDPTWFNRPYKSRSA